eukprot:COSAG06_NODE_257_length_18972_cov_14.659196_20_plen_81_part_01
MDGDGNLDELEQHIAKYDTNLDGTFSVAEVKAIVEELEREEELVSNMKWVRAELARWTCWARRPAASGLSRWPLAAGAAGR